MSCAACHPFGRKPGGNNGSLSQRRGNNIELLAGTLGWVTSDPEGLAFEAVRWQESMTTVMSSAPRLISPDVWLLSDTGRNPDSPLSARQGEFLRMRDTDPYLAHLVSW